MKTFIPGQELKTRSIGDHDCIFAATVISRSAKRVTIRMYGKVECIYPLGRYSMAPIFRAA